MAKRGGSNHYVRLRAPRKLPIAGRKGIKWLLAPSPGRHGKENSISAGVLLRDVLSIASDLKEAKRILNEGNFEIDGKKVRDVRASVGLMDIISLPKKGKSYRMQMVSGRIEPKQIKADEAKFKLCKVVGKKTVPGGKIAVSMHDGRTLLADNNIKVGATLKMALPKFTLKEMLPLSSGVKCLVTEGNHAGEIAILEKIIERTGSMDSEAQLKSGSASFITVTKYLFVVDSDFA
jgi:small subunit ribosomal protein S4e